MISLEDGARKVIDVCARIRPGERVLVLTDVDRPPEVVRALIEAIRAAGGDGAVAHIPSGAPAGGEPPDDVLALIARADVLVTPTTRVMYHWKAAHGVRGGRVLSLTGPRASKSASIAPSVGVVRPHIRCVSDYASGLTRPVRSASRARLEQRSRRLSRVAARRANTAIVRGPELQACPTIEAFIAPIENSANGTIVIDGSTSFGLV